jgi:hypothetical protein
MQAKKMSQLQKIIKQPKGNTGTTSYSPKSDDEQAFVDKHEIQFTDDANGNGDDVFKGMIVKKISRASSRHGYDSPKDQSVNESLNQLIEMSAKMKKKRHEISLALKRENPDWSMDKVFAIATSTAQKAVKEEYGIVDDSDQIDELSTPVLKKYLERSGSQLTKHFNKDDDYKLNRFDVKKRIRGRDLAIKKVYGANPYDDNDKEPKVRSTKPKVIIHGFKEENSESEKGEYLKGVRKRVAQRRSELYKDYADKDEKSGKSSGSVYRKMAKRQAELAKEEFNNNDIDVSILELYLDLDDDNKAILIEMLDNGLEDLITEFIAENKNA